MDAILFTVHFILICTLAFSLPFIVVILVESIRKKSFKKSYNTPASTFKEQTRAKPEYKPRRLGVILQYICKMIKQDNEKKQTYTRYGNRNNQSITHTASLQSVKRIIKRLFN